MKIADVCRLHGISEANFYQYKAKYGGMDISDAKRLKALSVIAVVQRSPFACAAGARGLHHKKLRRTCREGAADTQARW